MSEFILEEGQLPYADVFDVGDETVAVVTRMRELSTAGFVSQTLETGDILRRTCVLLGYEACAKECQAPFVTNLNRRCSDKNLRTVTRQLGVKPDELLMVGVTADEIGFADQLDKYAGRVKSNSVGIRELPGFNAFFARNSENLALGGRMADCGFVVLEFKDRNEETVRGFMHLSRTNMRGPGAYEERHGGKSVFEFFLAQAMDHYGADVASVKVRLPAAVTGPNFIHSYKNTDDMENHYPGWNELGFMHPMVGEHTSLAWGDYEGLPLDFDCLIDYREMIEWQILESIKNPALRLSPEQFMSDGCVDTGDLSLGHASHHWGGKRAITEARDAYFVIPRSPAATSSQL